MQDQLIALQADYKRMCDEDIAQGESEADSFFCETKSDLVQLMSFMPIIHNEL